LEAIQKALELKPDLVLMDISMPNMNGIEATKQIRKQAPDTKIILLSMHDSPQIAQQGKQAGANAYVVKSSSTVELQKTIKSVMGLL
jgi:two-component system nitrate/nitrite response regulator NarL